MTNANKREWVIHLISNGCICEECGEVHYPYVEGICNAHTHGMRRLYDHPEFQVIIDYPPQVLGYILNTLGDMVASGTRFNPGYVAGVFDDCLVELLPVEEEGDTLYRVVIPDKYQRWPGECGCDYPYSEQLKSLDGLECPDEC